MAKNRRKESEQNCESPEAKDDCACPEHGAAPRADFGERAGRAEFELHFLGQTRPTDPQSIRRTLNLLENTEVEDIGMDADSGRLRIHYSGGCPTLRRVVKALSDFGLQVPRVSVSLSVRDMRCHECERRIMDMVGHLPGVMNVSADAQAKLVEVSYINPATLDAVCKTLTNIGYPVSTDS